MGGELQRVNAPEVEPLAVWQIPADLDLRDALGAGIALLRTSSPELRAAALAAAWRARNSGEDAADLLRDRESMGPLAVQAGWKPSRTRARSGVDDAAKGGAG